MSTVIGGSDGPTSIFLAGKIGGFSVGWLNIFGLILMILILLPNMIYAHKFKDAENKCTNKVMNITEQVGRYSTMFLMVFNIGIAELGFSSIEACLIYGVGNLILLAAYWCFWLLYFKEQKMAYALALAIIPTGIFLLSGITMRHILLIVTSVIFGIGHIYVSYANNK